MALGLYSWKLFLVARFLIEEAGFFVPGEREAKSHCPKLGEENLAKLLSSFASGSVRIRPFWEQSVQRMALCKQMLPLYWLLKMVVCGLV